MKVILEVNGWSKEENIDDYSFRRGSVEIQFLQPPIKWVAPIDRTVVPRFGNEPVLRLIHTGEHRNGIPVFSFK